MKRKSKYGSHKKTFAGLTFDSALEMNRYIFLLGLLNDGHIRNLRRQVPYVLIEDVTDTREVQLKTKVKTEEYTVEKGCKYFADFVYERRRPDGEWIEVIEDTKSVATRKKASYVIKRKLMRTQGHIIKEVLTATEEV